MNTYAAAKKWLIGGLDEVPRSRLLLGPRSVGKSTLLLECAEQLGDRAIYVTGDDPTMLLPDAWDRVWAVAGRARPEPPVVLLDEAHLWPRWWERIEEAAGRLVAEGRPAHVVAAASAVRLAPPGTRGRAAAQPMDTATLAHWSASSVAATFEVDPADAADALLAFGGYPGAFEFMTNRARWAAYVRDTVINPALDRDLPALAPIRQPALLRQVFAAAALHPCEVLSLQHIQARLLDRGSLTTIALYLRLLGDAGLVAPLPRFSPRRATARCAPQTGGARQRHHLGAAPSRRARPGPRTGTAQHLGGQCLPGPRRQRGTACELLARGTLRGGCGDRRRVGPMGRAGANRPAHRA